MIKLLNFLLYLYAFALPFEYWDPFGLVGEFSLLKMVGLMYITISFLMKLSFVSKYITYRYFLPIFFFFIYFTIVNIVSLTIYIPFQRSFINISLLNNIILFYILGNHLSIDSRVSMKALFFFSLGIVALGILYMNGIGLVFRQGRLSVFGDNPNNQGTKVAFGIIILIYLFIKDSFSLKKYRVLFLLPTPILFQFILETASRGALLTMLLGIVLIIFFNKTKSKYFNWLMILVGGLAIFYSLVEISQNDLIYGRINNVEDIESIGGRTDIWLNTIQIFLSSPIFGVGEDIFSFNMSQLYGSIKSAHNYFLYVLVTSGLIGILIYLIFLYRIFISASFLYKNGLYIYLILYIEVLFAMFRQGGTLGDKFYWFVFSIICGVYVYNNKLNRIKNPAYINSYAKISPAERKILINENISKR